MQVNGFRWLSGALSDSANVLNAQFSAVEAYFSNFREWKTAMDVIAIYDKDGEV